MRKKTPKYDQESVLFTSDLHFFHKAQVKRRGFSTAENMNGFLIRRWNARVYPWHTVFVLGDVSLGNAADTMGVLEQLNGNLHLIRGNHDKGLQSKVLNMFGSVSDYAMQRSTLCR